MLDWRAMPVEVASGTLYLVATPIGNLEDITLRALRALKEADLIACEDTRHTRRLLEHYAIEKPTISYHEHNERQRAEELLAKLREGKSVALVSDAGTPGVSDPGFRVVALALQAGIRVVPLPGAAAFVTALAASGLPTDSVHFRGFLPAKAGERRALLAEIRGSQSTEIFYEAPHRLQGALQDVVEVLGESRPLVVARELTKIHEEFLRGTAGAVLQQLGSTEVRGEITLLIGKADSRGEPKREANLAGRLRELMSEEKLDEKAALKRLARELNVSKSELYRRLQRTKPKRQFTP